MLSMDIDFGTLTLRDALDLAVLIEEEAQERYEEFAAQLEAHHTPEAARFFRFMAGNEEKHGAELSERRAELFGTQPARVSRQMIFDVEAPEYDEVRAFMTPREALQAAFRAEKKAYTYFVKALPQVKDPGVRKLFEELRGEEVQHQQLVLAELEKTPPDPALKADDFADEPVAQ
jgi:rubrerythrin